MVLWDLLLAIFWTMILFSWLWLLVMIFGDIFRDHEMSGWAKAAWSLGLIVLPWLGALVYMVVRGSSMNERARAQVQRDQEALGRYDRQGTTSTADEISKLADLRERGAISAEEFQRAKAKVLGAELVPTDRARRDEHPVPSTT